MTKILRAFLDGDSALLCYLNFQLTPRYRAEDRCRWWLFGSVFLVYVGLSWLALLPVRHVIQWGGFLYRGRLSWTILSVQSATVTGLCFNEDTHFATCSSAIGFPLNPKAPDTCASVTRALLCCRYGQACDNGFSEDRWTIPGTWQPNAGDSADAVCSCSKSGWWCGAMEGSPQKPPGLRYVFNWCNECLALCFLS